MNSMFRFSKVQIYKFSNALLPTAIDITFAMLYVSFDGQ